MEAKKKEEEAKKAEYRKKEILYIRHRIQKILLDKTGKEPEVEVHTPAHNQKLFTYIKTNTR
jgi:hypothetical protein